MQIVISSFLENLREILSICRLLNLDVLLPEIGDNLITFRDIDFFEMEKKKIGIVRRLVRKIK